MSVDALEVDNFLDAYFREIAEKFLRLKGYIKEQAEDAGLPKDKGLVAALASEIDDDFEELVDTFNRFERYRNRLDRNAEEDLFISLLDFSTRFQNGVNP